MRESTGWSKKNFTIFRLTVLGLSLLREVRLKKMFLSISVTFVLVSHNEYIG